MQECVKDQIGHDHASELDKHAVEMGHLLLETDSFEVIGTECHNNAQKKNRRGCIS